MQVLAGRGLGLVGLFQASRVLHTALKYCRRGVPALSGVATAHRGERRQGDRAGPAARLRRGRAGHLGHSQRLGDDDRRARGLHYRRRRHGAASVRHRARASRSSVVARSCCGRRSAPRSRAGWCVPAHAALSTRRWPACWCSPSCRCCASSDSSPGMDTPIATNSLVLGRHLQSAGALSAGSSRRGVRGRAAELRRVQRARVAAANAFSGLGVARGDRVADPAAQLPGGAGDLLGLRQAGRGGVPLSSLLLEEGLVSLLSDARPRRHRLDRMLSRGAVEGPAAPRRHAGANVVLVDGEAPDMSGYARLVAAAGAERARRRGAGRRPRHPDVHQRHDRACPRASCTPISSARCTAADGVGVPDDAGVAGAARPARSSSTARSSP